MYSMDNLLIVNRSTEAYRRSPILGNDVWTTCLRQIHFQSSQDDLGFNLEDTDQVFVQEEAFGFLIEVLCGLHSPVFGETEVFGQFKTFVDNAKKNPDSFFNSNQNKWLRFIFETVKQIRHEHLTHIGSQSYGSTLRRLTKNASSVDIIGAGNLTTEILPWITKNTQTRVLVRDVTKYAFLLKDFPQLKIENIKDVKNLRSYVIIAAPIENKSLAELVITKGTAPKEDIEAMANPKTTPVTQISNTSDYNESSDLPSVVTALYDLRASGFPELKSLLKNFDIEMTSLQNFFEIFKGDQIRFSQLKEDIKLLIKDKCKDFVMRSEVRPMGWDDLCL